MINYSRSVKRLLSSQFKWENVNFLGGFSVNVNFFSSKTNISKKNNFGIYEIVQPANVSSILKFPTDIQHPSYAIGNPFFNKEEQPDEPEIKNAEQIKKMRKSCSVASYILDSTSKMLRVGMTTDEIDRIVFDLCIKNKVYPSPLHYCGFPKSVCTSVNNVACHGIPDDRPLCDGDIINIDVSVYVDGYHGDCSATYAVGNVDEKGRHLIEATKQCLDAAISICRDGEYFSTIGEVISESAEKLGYQVVPCFAGHGIGEYFHGPPDIYHISNDYPGKMKTGMTFTIEPVLTQGEPEITILKDSWTAVTVDDARTAQFEHTILINGNKAEILTKVQTSCDS